MLKMQKLNRSKFVFVQYRVTWIEGGLDGGGGCGLKWPPSPSHKKIIFISLIIGRVLKCRKCVIA